MNSSTYRQQIKSLAILHGALVLGLLVFFLLAWYRVQNENIQTTDESIRNIFGIMVVLFLAGGLSGSHLLFKSRLHAARRAEGLDNKLLLYRAALIGRYALIEGPAIFCMVVYMITGYTLFSIAALLAFLYFVALRPTVEKAGDDLMLSTEEKEKFY